MKKLIKRFASYLMKIAENPKGFEVNSEACLEFTCNNIFASGSSAYIYFRQPTSQEIRDFNFATLASEQSKLRKIKGENIDVKDTYNILMAKKIIPFAEKIITKVVGYKDKEGNDTGIEYVKKYWVNHLELVCKYAYSDESFGKKKDLT